MANRGRGRSPKKPAKRAGKRSAARLCQEALGLASEMEEPLHQAEWLVRVLERPEPDLGDEAQAGSFVATEARVRLESVHAFWSALHDTLAGRPFDDDL